MEFIQTPRERTIQLNQTISTYNSGQFFFAFNSAMDYARAKEDAKVITIQICCGGGSASVAFGIIDLIKLAEKEGVAVQTVGIGHVGSAAVPILMAGTNRFVLGRCEIFVHNGRTDPSKGLRLVERIQERKRGKIVDEIYTSLVVESSKGKMSKEKFKELCNKVTYITGQNIVDFGFADAIL